MEIEAEGPAAAATEFRGAAVEVSEREKGVCVRNENAIFVWGREVWIRETVVFTVQSS